MKRIAIFLTAFIAAVLLLSAGKPDGTPQEKYIARYAPIAVSEMYRSGVPASITLAQGLLESRYGLSDLAAIGNNHFGIKCHKWTGKTMRVDDDRKGECFRVYDSAESSFRDHSDFLRYQDRYKFLFENKTTDYKAWAYGLKKAGYATDPSYPQKLIKLVEDYGLSKYDTMSPKEAEAFVGKAAAKSEEVSGEGTVAEGKPAADEKKVSARESRKARKAAKKEARKRKKRQSSAIESQDSGESVFFDKIPESPLSIEKPKKITPKEVKESYTFSLSRQLYSRNGVPFIYACKGETVESIAKSNNLFLKELRKFNDAPAGWEPQPGEIVYLQAKKKQGAKGLDKYIVGEDGESLRDISQRFGVRMESLMKMNSFARNEYLSEGETVILRK